MAKILTGEIVYLGINLHSNFKWSIRDIIIIYKIHLVIVQQNPTELICDLSLSKRTAFLVSMKNELQCTISKFTNHVFVHSMPC